MREHIAILGQLHHRVRIVGRRAIVQACCLEVGHVRECQCRFCFNDNVLFLCGKLHCIVFEVEVAEQRDAVHVKPFEDEGRIGRAV